MELLKAQYLIKSKGLDAMLITSLFNFCYATGIYDSTLRILSESGIFEDYGVIIPAEGAPAVLVNDALLENLQENKKLKDLRTIPNTSWVVRKKKIEHFASSWLEGLAKICQEKGVAAGKIGIETNEVSIKKWNELCEYLPDADLSSDVAEIMWRLRSVKTPSEIEKISEATKVTEKAISALFESVQEGLRDWDVFKELRRAANEAGMEIRHAAWGVGPGSGKMFSTGSGRKITKGDVIRLDIGVENQGYVSDIARAGVVGPASSNIKQLYDKLISAEREAISQIKPGKKLSEIWEAVHEVMRNSGYKEYTRGMVGHCLGLETEELPFITKNATDWEFEKGMVFCVEVPWYEPGLGGFNIEDTVLVTEEGCEELSQMERKLYEL